MAQEQEETGQRVIGGMFKETSPMDQPQGTVRFVRNGNLNDTLGAYSNEGGISVDINIPNAITCGTIPLENGLSIVFLKLNNGNSEIGLHSLNSYITVLGLNASPNTDVDLNFDPEHPISGTFKIQGDGDLMIYWTDDLNPPRSLNLTRQLEVATNTLYGVLPTNSPDTKFVNRLNLFPHAGPVPHIELISVVSGGGCLTGSYQLALAYTDSDLMTTNYVTIGNPVPIVDEPEGVQPIESYDGAPAGVLTGKSILWNISNLNTDMKYLSVTILQRQNGVLSAVQLKDIEINNRTSFEVMYSGEQTATTSSPEAVLVDKVEYVAAKSMEQLDSTLYLGNLRSNVDIGYQKYANFIKAEPVVHPFPRFDPFMISDDFLSKKVSNNGHITDGYRWPNNVHDLKGYTRDEVYAFYIAFILKSGQMSYAYHIPGRTALQNVPSNQLEHLGASFPASVSEDGSIDGQGIIDNDIVNLTGTGSSAQGRLYQWYDFSHLTSLGSRSMNYWHNLHEFYPSTEHFLTEDVQQPGIVQEDLRNTNVRLHRFPSNRNATYTTVKSTNAGALAVTSKSKMVIHWYWFNGLGYNGGNSATTIGAFPTENYQLAWQAQDAVGTAMGGEGANHDINDGPNSTNQATLSAGSCHPEYNLLLYNRFSHQGNALLLGCVSDDVEFIYDTNIPVGSQVIIGWDPPAIHNLCQTQDHCGIQGQATVTSVSGNTVQYSTVTSGCQWPDQAYSYRGGWVAWMECESTLNNSNELNHEVQALGIDLSDIKIPASIADQVQGFRIYYAKRTHENRTVLGQAPMHPMNERFGVDPSGCDGGGIGTGLIDYWLPGGIPNPMEPTFYIRAYSFHDFYLLNRTPSLAQATHVRLQYMLGMFNFKGHTEYYFDGVKTDLTDPTNLIYSCRKPEVITSFHLSGDHGRHTNSVTPLNHLFKDRSRAYVLGGTIYEGAALGFEKSIYNIGGHTHIALFLTRPLPYLPSGLNAGWRALRSDHSSVVMTDYTNTIDPVSQDKGLMLHQVNLMAFKTDVYSPIDSQELVWTGFEVTGSDLDRFVVGEDGRSPSGFTNTFRTGPIFGGDTYICRHGYRMTHREEINNVPMSYPNSGSVDHKSVIMTIAESTENINFRHIDNDKEPYFPGDSLKNLLKLPAEVDLTYNPDPVSGKIRYNEDYSAVNDVKRILPFPFYLEQSEEHPARVIRSARTSSSSLIDNYRNFYFDQSKELNNRYGELWKISSMNNLLLFHMENALYLTKGKQRMKVSEGNDAYVGSGDIFEQEPDLVRHTDHGYLGTLSQYSALVTPEGYFFVDQKKRKVFFVNETAEELSGTAYGMSSWFQDNIPFELETYGLRTDADSHITGLGMHAVWDERYNRVILTKRDLSPTRQFTTRWKGIHSKFGATTVLLPAQSIISVNGILYMKGLTLQSPWTPIHIHQDTSIAQGSLFSRTGWTISFSVQRSKENVGRWESFHDYVPYLYGHSGLDVISFADGLNSIYRHNDMSNMGVFYGTRYPFEIEIISNSYADKDKLFYAFSFLVDVKSKNITDQYRNDLHAGFSSFITWSSDSISGENPLEYLINMRRIGSEWRVTDFRDMSAQTTSTAAYYTGPYTGSNYNIPNANIFGGQNNGTVISNSQHLFTMNGMSEILNLSVLDLSKPWHQQGKFTGRYMGIRLIADNEDNKLINLYSVLADFRPYHR